MIILKFWNPINVFYYTSQLNQEKKHAGVKVLTMASSILNSVGHPLACTAEGNECISRDVNLAHRSASCLVNNRLTTLLRFARTLVKKFKEG